MAKKTKIITVAYSYRTYEERELEVPIDLDTDDEDAVRDALADEGAYFSEDEEWSLDYAEDREN